MAFCRQNEQTARFQHLGLFVRMFRFDPGAHLIGMCLGIGVQRLDHLQLDVAAQLDVRAATGHVRCNRHRAQFAGVSNDLRFLLVLAGVQHIMRDVLAFQQVRQELRLFDGCRADENRLVLLMRQLDFLDHALELLARRAIDLIVFVLPLDRAVRRHLDHAKTVDFHEFVGFGQGRAGHATEFVIQAEIILERDRGQRHVLRTNRHAFLCLDRLMQTVRQPAARHHPAREFVN